MGWLGRILGSRFDGKKEAAADGWNDFLDRYCMREYHDVETAYRPAVLVFRYYSEVYNGGHLQFFLNRRDAPMEAVSLALEDIAGMEAARNFDEALAAWRAWYPEAPATAEEFTALAKEEGLEDYDQFVYRFEPYFDELLMNYLAQRNLI